MLTADQLRRIDPLFKGCTRPAMVFDIPIKPLIGVFVSCFLLGMWGLFIYRPFGMVMLLIVLPVALLRMRQISKQDDFRLEQLLLKFTMRARQANQRLWGQDIAAYSPIRYKRNWK